MFESIKCGVKSSRCGLSASTGLDLRLNCDPIRNVFEAQYGKKNDLLKLAEREGFIHTLTINYCKIEEIGEPVNS